MRCGADDHQLAAHVGAAGTHFPLAGHIVELQPAVGTAVHDALAAQDHAVIAGVQFGEGVLHFGLGELAGRLHAPAGEYFIGVVVVMMMTAAAMTVMIVMMLVLLVVMLVMVMMMLVMIVVMMMVLMLVIIVVIVMMMLVIMVMAAAIIIVVMMVMMMLMLLFFMKLHSLFHQLLCQ